MIENQELEERVVQLQQELEDRVERIHTFLSLTHQAYGCIECDTPISTQLSPAQQASCMLSARLVDCNDEFARIYGASSAGDLIGVGFSSLIFSNEQFVVRARRFVTSGYRLIDEEIDYTRSDGTRLILVANYIGETSQSGLIRMWVTIKDVTLRRLIEQATSGIKNDLPDLARQLDSAFWMLDWKKFSVIFVGDAFETLWKFSKQELIEDPMRWLDAIHEDDRSRVNGAFLSHVPNGTYDETYRLVLPDKSIRLIRDRAFPLPGRDGSVERVVGLATDITESEHHRIGLDYFFDSSKELLVVIDSDGNFQQVNPSFCNATGYDESELNGTAVLDLIHVDDHEFTNRTVDNLKSGVAAVDVRNRFHCKDESWRQFEWNIAPLSVDGVLCASVKDCTNKPKNSVPHSVMILFDLLTPRESEIMKLIVNGKPNKSIAKNLGISQRTVEKHRQRVMEKLDVDNLADLVRLALAYESTNHI